MKKLKTAGKIMGSRLFFILMCFAVFFISKFALPRIYAWDQSDGNPPSPNFQVIGHNRLLDQFDVLDTRELLGPKGYFLDFTLPDDQGEIDLSHKFNYRYILDYSVDSDEHEYVVKVRWKKDNMYGTSLYAVNGGKVILLHNQFFHPAMTVTAALIALCTSLVATVTGKIISWLTREK